MSGKAKYYVVWKGRRTGVYSSWEACAAQVQGFPGARFKAFASRLAAEKALRGSGPSSSDTPAARKEWLFSPHPPVAESWCVDASCSGNPGRLEFRGLDLRTGRQIFHEGPFEHGTNNVGEFLAIVQALRLLEQKHSPLSVYSDSSTAIGWVRKRRCNTDLAADEKNDILFELISHAEDWLDCHAHANPILKWDTDAWGEIPADFNRK
jgi:ribonuclease HI